MHPSGPTTSSQASPQLALLIDSDNVSAAHLDNVLAELASYGTVSVRRMYGDWTSDRLRGWKDAANAVSYTHLDGYKRQLVDTYDRQKDRGRATLRARNLESLYEHIHSWCTSAVPQATLTPHATKGSHVSH